MGDSEHGQEREGSAYHGDGRARPADPLDSPRVLSRRRLLRLGLGVATAGLIGAAVDLAVGTGPGDAMTALGTRSSRTGVVGDGRHTPASSTSSGRASSGDARPTATTTARPSPATTSPATTTPATTVRPDLPGATPTTVAPSAGASPGSSARSVAAGGGPPPASALRYFGPSDANAVYLTIDDGWYPSTAVLDLVRAEHLPVTTFLIARAAADSPEHLAYWRSFVDAGGVIQNHTVSHPWLTACTAGEIEAQWEGASANFASWFGSRPTLGRPPYGAVDEAVWRAAANCGLHELVMWSGVDNGHGLETWNGGPLAAGTIVLMHWDPGLYGELRQVLAACERQGLVPRPLPTTGWPASPA